MVLGWCFSKKRLDSFLQKLNLKFLVWLGLPHWESLFLSCSGTFIVTKSLKVLLGLTSLGVQSHLSSAEPAAIFIKFAIDSFLLGDYLCSNFMTMVLFLWFGIFVGWNWQNLYQYRHTSLFQLNLLEHCSFEFLYQGLNYWWFTSRWLSFRTISFFCSFCWNIDKQNLGIASFVNTTFLIFGFDIFYRYLLEFIRKAPHLNVSVNCLFFMMIVIFYLFALLTKILQCNWTVHLSSKLLFESSTKKKSSVHFRGRRLIGGRRKINFISIFGNFFLSENPWNHYYSKSFNWKNCQT